MRTASWLTASDANVLELKGSGIALNLSFLTAGTDLTGLVRLSYLVVAITYLSFLCSEDTLAKYLRSISLSSCETIKWLCAASMTHLCCTRFGAGLKALSFLEIVAVLRPIALA